MPGWDDCPSDSQVGTYLVPVSFLTMTMLIPGYPDGVAKIISTHNICLSMIDPHTERRQKPGVFKRLTEPECP